MTNPTLRPPSIFMLRGSAIVTALIAANTAFADEPVVLPLVQVQEKALDNARAQIAPSLGATSYTLDADKIDAQSQGENASFDQTFYRFPGVAQDELDKRLHVRGEEADLQYRVNGLLLPDGLSVFGQELSTRFLDSVSLITGTLPAQYGNRTAGIIDLKTKSGQDLNGGTVSVYGGSYGTIMPSLEYGGSTGQLSGYGTLSFRQDQLGMANPNSTLRATHDETNQYKGFGNFSYLLDDDSRLTWIVSFDNSSFQIPTANSQTPQYTVGTVSTFNSADVNETQNEQAYYEILGYQKSFGNLDLQVTQSTRYSDAAFNPDNLADIVFNGIASKTNHQLVSNNLQTDISDKINSRHTIRTGFSGSLQQARITSTDTVLPATWNAVSQSWVQSGTTPETIADNYSKIGQLYGIYLQDEWRVTPELTVNYGARYDVWSAYITETQFSPRLNLVYVPQEQTKWHAGYGRYFTPPPLELIEAGDVAKFNNTTNGVNPNLPAAEAVKSERYHYFDTGINQDILSNLHLGIDAYYKIKKNVLDEGQFGPAMIFSPNNAATGQVKGIETTLSYDYQGFSIWGNAARSRAMAKGLTSGQWQFSPDEVAYMETHGYHLDHDQDWTASAGIAYKWDGTKIYADGLYGSGLHSGFCNQNPLPSYETFNLGITHDFIQSDGNDLKIRLDITNLADLRYEIRDGSGIGVFAPQYLPRRGIYGGISQSF